MTSVGFKMIRRPLLVSVTTGLVILSLCVFMYSMKEYELYAIISNSWNTGQVNEHLLPKTTKQDATPFEYKPPKSSGINQTGRPFSSDLKKYFKTMPQFIELEGYDMMNFTIVTASDQGHFKESVDMVAGFQEALPNHTIVYYDLGLLETQKQQVSSWCGVEYRTVNLQSYPSHFSRLVSYGFKGLLYYEALREFEAILWLDASIRPVSTRQAGWKDVLKMAQDNIGIAQFDRTHRDVFQCTTSGMYDYLVTDQQKLKTFEMYGSGATLMFRTEQVYWNILHWFYLCSLTEACINPPGHQLNCSPHSVPGKSICHRYDQSILSILIGNLVGFDQTKYIPADTSVIMVNRGPTSIYHIQTCKAG